MTNKGRKRKYKELWAYETGDTKACSMCLKIKSVEKFPPDAGGRRGLAARCRFCKRVYDNKQYKGRRDPRIVARYKLQDQEDKNEKVCKECLEIKPLSEFHILKNGRKGAHPACKKCTNVKRKKNYDSQASRNKHLKYKYGITIEDYENLFEEQNGRCAICGKNTKLVVDHNHGTGQVRKLLCNKCNVLLGMAEDAPDILKKAAAYLETHSKASED